MAQVNGLVPQSQNGITPMTQASQAAFSAPSPSPLPKADRAVPSSDTLLIGGAALGVVGLIGAGIAGTYVARSRSAKASNMPLENQQPETTQLRTAGDQDSAHAPAPATNKRPSPNVIQAPAPTAQEQHNEQVAEHAQVPPTRAQDAQAAEARRRTAAALQPADRPAQARTHAKTGRNIWGYSGDEIKRI